MCRTWCTLHLLTNTKILWRTRATNLKSFICGKRNIQVEVKLSLPKDSKQARDFTADHAFFYFLYISFCIPSEVLCSSMLAGGKVDKKLNLIKQCALLAKKVAAAYWPALTGMQSREVVILHHVTRGRPHWEYCAAFGNPQYRTWRWTYCSAYIEKPPRWPGTYDIQVQRTGFVREKW